jgi:hypothetical protein
MALATAAAIRRWPSRGSNAGIARATGPVSENVALTVRLRVTVDLRLLILDLRLVGDWRLLIFDLFHDSLMMRPHVSSQQINSHRSPINNQSTINDHSFTN